MKVTRFEQLQVWQKAKVLTLEVYRTSRTGPFARDFGLRDQVQRAAVSVMSNIAEGFGRHSRADMRHFLAMARGSAFEIRSRRYLSIARGSAAEVQSQLYLARELGYLTSEEHRALNALCHEISRMLAALRTSLDKPPPPRT